MFGTNEIIGQKYFKTAPKDSLFVTSMFFTIQGEGPFAGKPALFIRLTKCNLNCSFCDTFFDDGEWMTFDQIETKAYATICDYWNNRSMTVPEWILPRDQYHSAPGSSLFIPGPFNCILVVTGGEPLLQTNLINFLERQFMDGIYTDLQIESNGTVNQDVPDYVTLVCSPKCSEKKGVAIKYLAPSKLILERADCLKFVMSADKNSPYNVVPEWAHKWKHEDPDREVYCSPMNIYNTFPQKIKLLRAEKGTITMAERSTVDEIISFWEPGLLNLQENQSNHEYTAKYCLDHGFRLNLQQHLYVSMA